MLIKNIPIGACEVAAGQLGSFEAWLGNSVGVVIYDRERNVGGIIHILHPRCKASKPPSNPALYASTGMPHLLETLEDAGAEIDKIPLPPIFRRSFLTNLLKLR